MFKEAIKDADLGVQSARRIRVLEGNRGWLLEINGTDVIEI